MDDDIKGPSSQDAPNLRDPVEEEEVTEPATTAPDAQNEPKTDAKKTWLVVLLVVLAFAIGAAGVYFWQQSTDNSDETAQLQSQIDATNAELAAAKEAAANKTEDEKDEEIVALTAENTTLTEKNNTLTAEKMTLTASNVVLAGKNADLIANCQAEGLDENCNSTTTP